MLVQGGGATGRGAGDYPYLESSPGASSVALPVAISEAHREADAVDCRTSSREASTSCAVAAILPCVEAQSPGVFAEASRESTAVRRRECGTS